MFVLLALSCREDIETNTIKRSDSLFVKLSPKQTGLDFANEVKDGIDFNVLTYRNFYNGGGVGIGDINNDGLNDIFFTANMESNRLFLNKGNLEFEDISDQAGISGTRGWSTGVSMVDINNDGYLDIYVSNSGDINGDDRINELYINNGDLSFSDQASEYGLDNSGFSTHASFFDYDLDGDLDCYVLNNSFKDPNKISTFKGTREVDDVLGGDRLMRNDGGRFVDVSAEAGIYTSAIGFGLGVSVGDVNNDALPDIYISNDFWERDYIYINKGDGKFSEELTDRLSICSVSSMGADIADVNNDGSADIFTTDMLAADNYRLKTMTIFDPYSLENYKYRSSFHYQILQNCLQINNGDGEFSELSGMSEMSATDWSWGALIFDFDNDGWKDIYVCNGIYKDIMDQDFTSFIADKNEVKKLVEEKGKFDFRDFLPYLPSNPLNNYAFKNQKNNKFQNQAIELGFVEKEFSNGAAYGDLDNDGDLDLVINNVNMPASLYENKSNQKVSNSYLKIKLKDTTNENHQGIGSKVVITTRDGQYIQELYTSRGFQSSVAPELVFGLGTASVIDTLKVIWPDRSVQLITGVPVDTTLLISKEEDLQLYTRSETTEENILKLESGSISGDITHKENDFNDFDVERLLPRMHSTEGPAIEVADINGDELEDFIVLGAAGDVDKLFIQTGGGKFEPSNIATFAGSSAIESTCAAFFDNDKDGDMDLLIGAGGNDISKGIEGFVLRYYENDGAGNFALAKTKTPPAAGQFSVIRPSDFDGDGDVDLFIAGRSIPGNYGLSPRSFLLRKDGDSWTDITVRSLGTAGMVTDANWLDVDNDKDLDLLLVGEWMPLMMFNNDDGKFERSLIVDNTEGWWADMTLADMDNDGDKDLVLSNWGLNSKFKASVETPITIDIKDFDGNGKTEFIINWKAPADDKTYPFHTKMDLTSQLPALKKKALKYTDYAKLSYEELLSTDERNATVHREVKQLNSCIMWNNGSVFELEELPLVAQTSPVFTSVVEDFNQDGLMDIWMGGNLYGLKPEVGRLNSSRGVLLLAKEVNGKINYIEGESAPIEGEIRSAKIINTPSGKKLLIGVNNSELKVLSF